VLALENGAELAVAELGQVDTFPCFGGVIPVGLEIAAIGDKGGEFRELFGAVEPVRAVKTPSQFALTHRFPIIGVLMMVSEGDGVNVGSHDIGARIVADDGFAHGEGIEERVGAELVAQVEYVEGDAGFFETLEEVEVLCQVGSLDDEPGVMAELDVLEEDKMDGALKDVVEPGALVGFKGFAVVCHVVHGQSRRFRRRLFGSPCRTER
jgi:hypothetical protein